MYCEVWSSSLLMFCLQLQEASSGFAKRDHDSRVLELKVRDPHGHFPLVMESETSAHGSIFPKTNLTTVSAVKGLKLQIN